MSVTTPSINQQRMLDRFLQYVKIDTRAQENAGQYPSSEGQWELGRLIVEQLNAIGLVNVSQDKHGIVQGTIPSNVDGDVPVVAFNSHLDTSPETSGTNVQPNVIENYPGGDIVLAGDTTKVITAATCPELDGLVGKTLITTDGTTLLGGGRQGRHGDHG